MVPGEKPVILLSNSPVEPAAPLVVKLSPVVGLLPVLQHIPCSVGFGSPRFEISLCPAALMAVIEVAVFVITEGNTFKSFTIKVIYQT